MSEFKSFKDLEAFMVKEHAEYVRTAIALSDQLVDPATANAEAVWDTLGTKPLYANTKVPIATQAIAALQPFIENGKWRLWGNAAAPFLELDGPANLDSSFRFTKHALHGLESVKIARKRLFAVQGAARMLLKRSAIADRPVADLVDDDLATLLEKLSNELGPRWGSITILHFLTDLGLAVKPDLHLVRSVRALGLVKNTSATSKTGLLEIVEAVRGLVLSVDGKVTARRLRYFDKILMDASRLELFAPEHRP